MKSSITRVRLLVGALLATSAFLALSVSSASAAAVPARWVNPGTINISGSLTLKRNGGNEKTCTMRNPTGGETFNFGTEGLLLAENPLSGWPSGYVYMECTGGTTLQLRFSGLSKFETSYYIAMEHSSVLQASPYGQWQQEAWKLGFTNGAPSTMSISNTKIGIIGSNEPITASGTLTIKRMNGENITLTH
ncbi:MAG TPA: hypothetical protein VFN85_05305 [Solirubrobacterales bacterium]|nr:hypothetical protein [Solirubrobacterales bacterium]